jgi:hypothetical protein
MMVLMNQNLCIDYGIKFLILNKDIAGLHAMSAWFKKKSEIATTIEQHALDHLRVATESLSCKQ